nr:choice-of-anchor D domain-containing protein [Bacteroidota bacterium]
MNNSRIEVYNTVTYELLKTFGGGLSEPKWIDITADGKYLYIPDSGIDDIVILDTETGEEVTSITGFTDPWGLKISPNGKWFAFRDGDNVKIGATETNTIIHNVPGIDNPRTPIWTPDNKFLYVGSWDAYKIHKIETETFTEVKVYNMPYKIWSINLTEDNEYLVAACADNDRVAIIELETDDISYVTVQDYPATICTFRTKQPAWLEEISQLAGSVESGSIEMIDLTLNTTKIPGGDYFAELWFNTNDPLALDFKYDITLHHNTGNPYLFASNDSLNFGNVWTGNPAHMVLTISNTGTETLEISSLTGNPVQFYTMETQLDIEPGSEYELTVYCNAPAIGFLDGSLDITSNGGNLSVYLEAFAYAPPVANVSPGQLSVTLGPDETGSQLLTLSNTGISDLEYYTTLGMHRDKYFIGNNNKYQILAWDAATNTSETIDLLFNGPWRMKYSPDGKYLWVTFEDQGYVAVLDANTNALLKYILVEGTRTSGVAFNKTGTYVYIGNWSENRVEIINAADFTWEGSITGSMSAPTELILAPDASKLFVTNNGNDDLVIIDLNTNTVVQSIDGNSTGYDMAISPDGNFVYWVDRYYINKVNTETNSIETVSPNYGELRGVTISDDGLTLYVCAYGNDKIIALETESLTRINEWSSWDELNNPIDISLSFDRVRLYVTLESENKVVPINLADDAIETTYLLGSSDMDFRDITSAGRISWLNVDLESDILPAGSKGINFNFDSESMLSGTYYADFGVYSNAPGDPEIIVPVEITILYGAIQTVNIPEGWSGISSYINPVVNNVENMFEPVLSELIILQNESGMYWPAQNVNSLGPWSTQTGYKIKVSEACVLTIPGEMETDRTLAMDEGWNLIPVISECETDVEYLFMGTELTIVKEVAGYLVYWPNMGINSLGYLEPGNAYFVMMESEGEIFFPECTPIPAFPLKGEGAAPPSIQLNVKERVSKTNNPRSNDAALRAGTPLLLQEKG